MEITPELPDGFEGQIKRLQCLLCKRYFYIPREYFDTHHPTYCHECSLILRSEIQKAQSKSNTSLSQTPVAHHPRTIDREKMTAVELIKEGRAYEKAGQDEEALLSYTQAVQKDPKNIYTYWSRAGVLAHLSRLDEALAVYDQAIQVEPSNFFAYNYLTFRLN